jgi:hypothetical protein
MPLALLVVGLMLLVSAMRGTTNALGSQLKKDLFGDGQQGGFIVWVVIIAILAVAGGVGASYGRKDVRNLTQLFMFVVLTALILRNPNVFQQFVEQINAAPVSPKVDENMKVDAPNDAETKSSVSSGLKTAANVAANWISGGMAGGTAGDMLENVAGNNSGNASSRAKLGLN